MRRNIGLAVLFALVAVVSICDAHAAESAASYCATGHPPRVATAVPQSLVAEVARTFNIGEEMAGGLTVRCVGRTLMACWVGANLNCGKANTRRRLPGASAFCRDNPGSDFIPMAATGHDTIYSWRCFGRRAVPGKPNVKLDADGYAADNWREVP
jgi:hypothetical protein